MKNKGLIITLISIISLLIISLIILMYAVINKKISFNFSLGFSSEIIEEIQIDKKYEENFKEININTNAAKIEIKKSEDDMIKLKAYSKEGYSKEEANNDTLTITVENEECKFLCMNIKMAKVELYIPEDYENKININNKYGDIEIDKFENLELEINEDAGDIKIGSVNTAVVDNKYGDIDIDYIKIGTITASAGDIKINNANNLKIENKYGDIELNNVNEYVNIQADCGDIEINNLNIIEDSNILNNYGDIEIKNTNAYVDAHTNLGDSKINNNQSNVTLKIENKCGDIEVN